MLIIWFHAIRCFCEVDCFVHVCFYRLWWFAPELRAIHRPAAPTAAATAAAAESPASFRASSYTTLRATLPPPSNTLQHNKRLQGGMGNIFYGAPQGLLSAKQPRLTAPRGTRTKAAPHMRELDRFTEAFACFSLRQQRVCVSVKSQVGEGSFFFYIFFLLTSLLLNMLHISTRNVRGSDLLFPNTQHKQMWTRWIAWENSLSCQVEFLWKQESLLDITKLFLELFRDRGEKNPTLLYYRKLEEDVQA